MITFSTQDVPMPVLDEPRVGAWIRQVAASYGMRIGQVNYIFCSDERELEVNRQFLAHDFYTDIITFDYSELPVLSGDVFISLDTVKSNAKQYGIDFNQELLRILIHGVLHLTGQGDKTPETRAQMTEKEDRALLLWPKEC